MKKSFKIYLRICKVSHIVKGMVLFRPCSSLADAVESPSMEFKGLWASTYNFFYSGFHFLKKIVQYTLYNALYGTLCNKKCKK